MDVEDILSKYSKDNKKAEEPVKSEDQAKQEAQGDKRVEYERRKPSVWKKIKAGRRGSH